LSQLFAFWTSFPNLYPFNARSFLWLVRMN
jgi:hypothetical protein